MIIQFSVDWADYVIIRACDENNAVLRCVLQTVWRRYSNNAIWSLQETELLSRISAWNIYYEESHANEIIDYIQHPIADSVGLFRGARDGSGRHCEFTTKICGL